MSHRLRLTSVVGMVVLFALGSASIAFAHAQYSSSTPASNATVSAAPTTLGVTFTEELASIQIAITGPHGSEVTTGKASIDLAHRTTASVSLKDDGPGVYTVVWHNVSGDDGDPNDGSFTFTVAGTPAAPAPPAASAPAATTAPAAAAAPAQATCIDNGQVTSGINDVRVNTYCKRQAIRDQYKGKLNELVFNYDLSVGMGLESSLKAALGQGG
jgi:methionine-rich copper-binding protein CopC